MKDYSLETEKIKQNLSRVRDIEIRRKASLLLWHHVCQKHSFGMPSTRCVS